MISAKNLTRTDVDELVDIVNRMEYNLLASIYQMYEDELSDAEKVKGLCKMIYIYADKFDDFSDRTRGCDIITAS